MLLARSSICVGAAEALFSCSWSGFYLCIFFFIHFSFPFLCSSLPLFSISLLSISKASESKHLARTRLCLSFSFSHLSPLSLFLLFLLLLSFSHRQVEVDGGVGGGRLFFLLSRRRLRRAGPAPRLSPLADLHNPPAHMFVLRPKPRLRRDQGVKGLVRRHRRVVNRLFADNPLRWRVFEGDK